MSEPFFSCIVRHYSFRGATPRDAIMQLIDSEEFADSEPEEGDFLTIELSCHNQYDWEAPFIAHFASPRSVSDIEQSDEDSD